MTLYQINEAIKGIALQHPFINEYGEGDIYEHLNSGEHKYALSFLTVDTIDEEADSQTLHGSLFYVDRLTADGSNRLQVQNAGINALQAVIGKLEEDYPGVNITSDVFTVFTAQFADLCAGVYASIAISYDNAEGTCDDVFESK